MFSPVPAAGLIVVTAQVCFPASIEFHLFHQERLLILYLSLQHKEPSSAESVKKGIFTLAIFVKA